MPVRTLSTTWSPREIATEHVVVPIDLHASYSVDAFSSLAMIVSRSQVMGAAVLVGWVIVVAGVVEALTELLSLEHPLASSARLSAATAATVFFIPASNQTDST